MTNPTRPAEVEAALKWLESTKVLKAADTKPDTLLAYITTLEASATGWRDDMENMPKDDRDVLVELDNGVGFILVAWNGRAWETGGGTMWHGMAGFRRYFVPIPAPTDGRVG